MQNFYVCSLLRGRQRKQATCVWPELLKTESPTRNFHAHHVCVSRLFLHHSKLILLTDYKERECNEKKKVWPS